MSTLKNNFGGNLFSNQSIYPRLHHQKRPPRQSSPNLLWHRSAKQQGLPLAKNNKSREKKCPGVFPLMIFKCILSHLFNMFCIFFSKRMFKMHFFTIHFQHVFFSHVFFRMCVKHVKTYGKMHCEKIHFGNVNKMWNSDKTCIPNHHFWSSNLCSYIGVASTAAVERHAICFRVF
jgi:hypothetical protein